VGVESRSTTSPSTAGCNDSHQRDLDELLPPTIGALVGCRAIPTTEATDERTRVVDFVHAVLGPEAEYAARLMHVAMLAPTYDTSRVAIVRPIIGTGLAPSCAKSRLARARWVRACAYVATDPQTREQERPPWARS